MNDPVTYLYFQPRLLDDPDDEFESSWQQAWLDADGQFTTPQDAMYEALYFFNKTFDNLSQVAEAYRRLRIVMVSSASLPPTLSERDACRHVKSNWGGEVSDELKNTSGESDLA